MASFIYGKHTPGHIGVWLKHESNPDVMKMIKDSRNKRFLDTVERVIVHEFDEMNLRICLQVWCKNLLDSMNEKQRWNVFYIWTHVNEDWVCHCDLGVGFPE